jgi:hypothetical protein
VTWGHFILTFFAGVFATLAFLFGPTYWGLGFITAFGADGLTLVYFMRWLERDGRHT